MSWKTSWSKSPKHCISWIAITSFIQILRLKTFLSRSRASLKQKGPMLNNSNWSISAPASFSPTWNNSQWPLLNTCPLKFSITSCSKTSSSTINSCSRKWTNTSTLGPSISGVSDASYLKSSQDYRYGWAFPPKSKESAKKCQVSSPSKAVYLTRSSANRLMLLKI